MSEKIIPVNLSQQFKSDYQRYALYVTYDRIMTDIKDGFKPVQRRLLYTMLEEGATTHTIKTATIAGAAMRYHGHGDQSLAGSVKPMVNWFESYLPVCAKQGSFGNIQGDPMAAPRYNEVRLSDFALEYIVGDMREASDSVNWVDNYDHTRKEPEYLSSALPMAMINGSFGIGVGKKAEIPCHNTNEVIDAILTLMDNPKANIVLIPDTCQHCEIFDDANWAEISKTGFGFFTVRGIIETVQDYSNENFKHRPAVIIHSIPDGIFLDTIINQVNMLVAKKKIIQIDSEFDESKGDNLEYVYILKSGTDPEYIKNVLYQNTSIQSTQRINFEMLNGLDLIRPSYRDYLLFFIEHRKKVKYRLFVNRLQQINTKLHEKEAFIKLMESGKIDQVIAKIRSYRKDNTKDSNELIEYIIKMIDVTDLQAKYIINANLGNLTPAYLKKLKEERAQLYQMRDQYFMLTTDDNAITEYIRQELLTIKQKYGCPRHSKLIHMSSAKDFIPTGPMYVAITEKGFIAKVPAGSKFNSIKNDVIKQIIEIDNADHLIIFDGAGKVFKLLVNKLPFDARTDLRFIFKTFSGNCVKVFSEDLLKKMRNKDKTSVRYHIVSITRSGFIKKMELDEFTTIPSSGLLYAKLDKGDYIQDLNIAFSNCSILVFNNKRVMTIPVNSISTMKRAARGNKTLKSGNLDGMIILNAKHAPYLICVTKMGKLNKVAFNSIPGVDKEKKEFSLIRLSKDDTIQNILCADDSQTLTIRCFNAGELQFPVKGITIGSSVSGGDKVLNLKNDQIIYSQIN